MQNWNIELFEQYVDYLDDLSQEEKNTAIEYLKKNIPFERFESERKDRKKALEELKKTKNLLNEYTQNFPSVYEFNELMEDKEELKKIAFFFTAGGEGQRLKESLEKNQNSKLETFTKATYKIKGLPENFGPLMVNLAIIKDFSNKTGISFPVIISLGPNGSNTYNLIPKEIEKNKNFGIENIFFIAQGERLHLDENEKITLKFKDSEIKVSKNPDETGGPFKAFYEDKNLINILSEKGIEKILFVQGTGIYNPKILFNIASAKKEHDAYILGVARQKFEKTDPFGSIVLLENEGKKHLRILESHQINDETRILKDKTNKYFLPINTGLYFLDLKIFKEKLDIPFYASSEKEIENSNKKAPKIGFAGTDFPRLAKNPAVLLINPEDFANLKTADSVDEIFALAKRYELDKICEKINFELGIL